MECDFLPEYSQMPCAGGCIGLYRLFSNASWRQVADPGTRKAVVYPDAAAAVRAAKEAVRIMLNPRIVAEESVSSASAPADEDILGVADFLERKREQLAQTQMFRKRRTMKPVVVERKQDREKRRGKKSG